MGNEGCVGSEIHLLPFLRSDLFSYYGSSNGHTATEKEGCEILANVVH